MLSLCLLKRKENIHFFQQGKQMTKECWLTGIHLTLEMDPIIGNGSDRADIDVIG